MLRMLRQLIVLSIFICICAGVAYGYFCKPLGFVSSLSDNQETFIVAKVIDKRPYAYAVSDPTGCTWILSETIPQVGSWVLVRCSKQTSNDKSFLKESWRVGTF